MSPEMKTLRRVGKSKDIQIIGQSNICGLAPAAPVNAHNHSPAAQPLFYAFL